MIPIDDDDEDAATANRRKGSHTVQDITNPSTPKCKAPDPAVYAVLELLAETFPACFVVYEGRRRPLKIGIHLDALAVLAGVVTPEELSAALGVYTHNRVYRSRLVAGAVRVDLNGQSAGVVTPEQAVPCRKPTPPVATRAQTAHEPAPRRLGLADLRAAARQQIIKETKSTTTRC